MDNSKIEKLKKEIKDFCKLNEISDYDGFFYECLEVGFNVARYGMSPKDNIVREQSETPKKTRRIKIVKKD